MRLANAISKDKLDKGSRSYEGMKDVGVSPLLAFHHGIGCCSSALPDHTLCTLRIGLTFRKGSPFDYVFRQGNVKTETLLLGIALNPADTQEEGFYFYIPLTKDVVKRATFTKCEVYTESINRVLLQQYHDEMQPAAKLQRVGQISIIHSIR